MRCSEIAVPRLSHHSYRPFASSVQCNLVHNMVTPPTADQFGTDLKPVIHLPTVGESDNILIFLCGLGDSSSNFANFAKALNLPDTCTATLQGPYPLPFPFGPGTQWSDDVQVDTRSGTFDDDSPLVKSTETLLKTVQTLQKQCGYRPDQIHLFGYGQGGSLALSIVLHEELEGKPSLGSVLSIGGILPNSARHTFKSKQRTPIMLMGGSKGALARDDGSPVKRIKDLCDFVEYHQWKKSNDGLPQSRDEAYPMLQFLARRLKSSRGVPAGAVEV